MAEHLNFKHLGAIIVLSFIFLMAGNGILNLTNPDEVFYAQTAKEMMQQKSWLVPYLFGQPQFEKPIFTYWLIKIAFMLFGVNNFWARFFPALFGILGVIGVYLFSLYAYKDKMKAFFSSLILMSGGLYIGLARTVFTDLIFSIFILLSLASFFIGYISKERKGAGIILWLVFSGLAVLTKGPLGFLITFTVVFLFLLIRKELRFLCCSYFLWGFLAFLLISVPWYAYMIKKFGHGFTHEFFYNDHIRRVFEAEHASNDTWYFYPLSMIGCMFPWSLFVIASFIYLVRKLMQDDSSRAYLFLACWISVVFIIFQPAHSKLVSYIFPLFPAMAIITADFICNSINLRKNRLILGVVLATFFICLLLPVASLVSANIYSMYLPSKAPVYNFIFFYLIILSIQFFLILKRKLLSFVYVLALNAPLLIFFVLFAHKNFDDFVSSKGACDYLLQNRNVENTIICSKFFLRGVRFYTDKDVAVINASGSSFFSPHPVIYLDTDAKIISFLKSQKKSYCIISKSVLADMQRLASNNKFQLNVLKVAGDEYVVQIEA